MDNKDAQLMEVKADEQLIKNYQAIYYAMNAKPDCKSKLFPQNVVVSLQDIMDLNEKITEKFKAHYEDAGFRINVCVSFKNRENIEFDSWTTFENYRWNTEKTLDSILIVWEYNAKLPNYTLPQKHTLTVRIADELRPEEVLNLVISGKLEEMDKIEQGICPIIARVDFINAILGEELLGIVETWQLGLPSPNLDTGKVFKILYKFKRIIAYAINYIPTLLITWCVLKYLGSEIRSLNINYLGEITIDSFVQLAYKCAYSIIGCFITYKVFQIIANIVFSSLRSTNHNHSFKITKGDKKTCAEVEKQLRNRKSKIIGNIIFTFLFNILCSIIANFLSS